MCRQRHICELFKHPWTDTDANLHSVADKDMPGWSHELHTYVMNANCKLPFSLKSYFSLFLLFTTSNMLSDVEAHIKFLQCGPSPKCEIIWSRMLILWTNTCGHSHKSADADRRRHQNACIRRSLAHAEPIRDRTRWMNVLLICTNGEPHHSTNAHVVMHSWRNTQCSTAHWPNLLMLAF